MTELDKYTKLLEEYNKEEDSEKYKELLSFVFDKQLEITNDIKINRPHTQDKFQPFRDLLNKIRKDLKLYNKPKHQYPPENLDISKFIEEDKEEDK